MTHHVYAALMLALLSCGGLARADDAGGQKQTCPVEGQKVIEIMGDEVGTYDQDGNFIADVKKSEIPLQQNILACRDVPALVKIRLTPDGAGHERLAWVNLLEVKVTASAATARKCKDAPISRVADTTTPATSGIDPCSQVKTK